jgi:hypothetical protein
MTHDDNEGAKTPDYSYRPSVLGAPWELRLTPSALAWSTGRRSGNIPYSEIRRVQLAFRPNSIQQGTFATYIWPVSGPKITVLSTSRKSLVEATRQDAQYRDFILRLHRHLMDCGARTDYVRGVEPYVYWPGLALMAICAVGFFVLIARALQTQAWGGAAFITVFFALFGWQLGNYFRRNLPGIYRPAELPPELLPRE